MFNRYNRPFDNKQAKKFGTTNSAFNYRREMNKSNKKGNIHGLFKHQDTRYLSWLKDQLEKRETRDKMLSYSNDILQANQRVNYRNRIDKIQNDIQRDNLNHNSLEHLTHQITQFRNLGFT